MATALAEKVAKANRGKPDAKDEIAEIRVRLAEGYRAKAELEAEVEAVERKVVLFRQRFTSNPASAEEVLEWPAGAARMADLRLATGAAMSDLAHLMR